MILSILSIFSLKIASIGLQNAYQSITNELRYVDKVTESTERVPVKQDTGSREEHTEKFPTSD